jgi:hypothetical protein
LPFTVSIQSTKVWRLSSFGSRKPLLALPNHMILARRIMKLA